MNRVVVTGMGVISPIGNNIQTFWENLTAGNVGIGPITRFDTEKYKVKLAAEVHDFDPSVYMSKSDISHSDLYAQYAIAAAAQAVEDSGVIGTLPPERVGVSIGTGIGGIKTFMTEHRKLLEKGPRRVSPFFIPMMIANMAAGTIAIRYQCKGAAMPAVTACASGNNALGEAMRAIRHGYADAMIAGGAEATVNEISAAGFTNMQALSLETDPLTACLPFDRRRSGFVMGEGAAGAVEAVASVLALREGLIPPTVGLNEPDPECDLDDVPNQARQAEVDLVLSNSLGFGGHNACLAFRKAE